MKLITTRPLIRIALVVVGLLFIGGKITAQKEYAFAKAIAHFEQKSKIFDAATCAAACTDPRYQAIVAYIGNPWLAANVKGIDGLTVDEIYQAALVFDQPAPVGIANFQTLAAGGTTHPGDLGASVAALANPAIGANEVLFAITDVFVERAKEELAIAFFERMRAAFERQISIQCVGNGTSVNIELRNVLPNIYRLIANLPSNLSPQIGNAFKAAMEQDMIDLPQNVRENLIAPCVSQGDLKYKIVNALFLVHEEVQAKSHAATVINRLALEYPQTAASDDFDHVVHLLNAISESMYDVTDPDRVWIKPGDFVGLTPRGHEFFFSLFYHHHTTLLGNLGINTALVQTDAFQEGMSLVVQQALNDLDVLAAFASEIGTLNKDKADFGLQPRKVKAYEFSVSTLNLLRHLLLIDKLNPGHTFPPVLGQALDASAIVLEVADAIQEKDYGQVAIKTFALISEFIDPDSALPRDLVKFVTLAADIAQADSGEDVKDIFGQAILPVGSYRIKRSTKFSTSIQAYVGFNGGAEWAFDPGLKTQRGWFGGLYLPVGLALNWSRGTEDRQRDANSLFFSVLDLGTLASFRLADTTGSLDAETLPAVNFLHVLAPGAYYVHGFRKVPLSVGIGVQMAPQLRDITDNNDLVLRQAQTLRANAFIAVDIPAFHISFR